MPTMRERRDAYRKAQEKSRKKEESASESLKWYLEIEILREFPEAEFYWRTVEHPGLDLEITIRLKDYALRIFLTHQNVENPKTVLAYLIQKVNDELSKGPIRYLFTE